MQYVYLIAESDFDSSYEQVFTFEANGGFRQRKPVEVSVVEDNVNEKSEEFLLFFDVVDPSDSVFINTLPGRNPVRCRIRNNDGESITQHFLVHSIILTF